MIIIIENYNIYLFEIMKRRNSNSDNNKHIIRHQKNTIWVFDMINTKLLFTNLST